MGTTKNIENNFVSRFKIIFYIFLVVGFVAIGRIFYLQFLKKDIISSDDIYKKETIPSTRGSILSYDGRPLAISVPSYELRWDSSVVNDSIFNANVEKLSRALSNYFKDKSAKQYSKDLANAKKKGNRYYLITKSKIDQTEVAEIKGLPIFNLGQYKGGLILIDKTKRVYPFGGLAYRTVGYIAEDGSGTGIEISHNAKLKGTDGEQTIQRTTGGNWIPANGEPYTPAHNGIDIRTTIDVYIQEAAETELRKKLGESDAFVGGTAIVMDVATGAVRASANMYKKKDGTFEESYNYAIGHSTEPGSTLKLAALMALLEDGYYNLNDTINTGNGIWHYAGAKITDTRMGGYGVLSVQESFEKSSNVAFAKMITKSYEGHPEDYVERLHNMKLVEKLNLDISGEAQATITSPDDDRWSKTSLASLGYGYALTLTPLHTLTFYNAVANGGKMMRPYFIESYEKDGIVYEQFEPQVVSGSICSDRTLKEVHKALRGVVENGTAKAFNDPRYQIAGKTGTAQISFNGIYKDAYGYKKHQASFAGYFPADNPKYSCIVVLYTDKIKGDYYGGSWAGPIFKGIADKIYAVNPSWQAPIEKEKRSAPDNPVIAPGRASDLNTAMDYLSMNSSPEVEKRGWVSIDEKDGKLTGKNLVVEPKIMPSVIGMGIKDALYLLENEGYKVSFSGAGKIYQQTPAAGAHLQKGEKITLLLK